MYAIAGNRDMYKPLPVNDTPRSFYTVIRAFALLNDIAVPDGPDLAVNELFGLKLDGPGWSELAGRRAMVGTLANRQGVMIKLVALDSVWPLELQAGGGGHVGIPVAVSA